MAKKIEVKMKTVGVRLTDSEHSMLYPYGERSRRTPKIYHYLCEETVKKGDHVVVDLSRGLKCAEVISVEDGRTEKATKHVVQVVDTTTYRERNENEARRANIIRELEARAQKKGDAERLRRLLSDDAEALALLDELDSLTRATT